MKNAVNQFEVCIISNIVEEDGKLYVKVKNDDDNFFLFEPQKYCKLPLVDFPITLEEDKAIPCKYSDATIEGKYCLVEIVKVIDEEQIQIKLRSDERRCEISLKDFRP